MTIDLEHASKRVAQPLEGSKEVDFQRYVAFISDNPSWPNIGLLRRRAEAALWKERLDPRTVRGYFDKHQPLTTQGKFALARALLLEGDRADAQKLVREAWRYDNFSGELEAQILDVFRDLITDADHKARMDIRLYAEDIDGAMRRPIAPAATRLSSYLAVQRGVPRFPTPGRPGAARNRAASRVVVDRLATLGEAKGAVSEKLGGVEGVSEDGRALTSFSPLAALTNRRRLFVNLLRGMTRFRRDRYRCWSSICARQDGLGKDFIGGRFNEASTQSQEAKRCFLRLKS